MLESYNRYTKSFWKENPEERISISEEHVERAKRGKGAWNTWAIALQKWIQQNEMESGFIGICNITIPERVKFRNFLFPCNADFTGTTFGKDANFNETIFTGYVHFTETKFNRDAHFIGVTYTGYLHLGKTKFSGNTYFRESTFNGNAYFNEATFSGVADFRESKFRNDAIFTGASFNGNANFDGSLFSGNANFMNAQFEKISGFEFVVFKNTPEFNFAIFNQPPYLSNVKIPFICEGSNVERYRKLKQMAIQSSDHANEVKFFGFETHAKYTLHETTWHEKIFIKAYWICSNFGASIGKPLLSLATFLIFMFFVNMQIFWSQKNECRLDTSLYFDSVVSFTLSESLPIVRLSRSESIKIKKCLFHTRLKLMDHLWKLAHLIPATLFLFLFGLGVRNRFKIK